MLGDNAGDQDAFIFGVKPTINWNQDLIAMAQYIQSDMSHMTDINNYSNNSKKIEEKEKLQQFIKYGSSIKEFEIKI